MRKTVVFDVSFRLILKMGTPFLPVQNNNDQWTEQEKLHVDCQVPEPLHTLLGESGVKFRQNNAS